MIRTPMSMIAAAEIINSGTFNQRLPSGVLRRPEAIPRPRPPAPEPRRHLLAGVFF